MDFTTAIDVLSERIEEENIVMNIPEFKLSELLLKKLATNDYICKFQTYNYQITSNCGERAQISIYNIDECEGYELLSRVYKVFKDDGSLRYSRIVDTLFCSDEEMEKEEEYKYALCFFSRKPVENCSVCMEPNMVLTSCNHNLCRYCAKKLGKKFKCPVCRVKLTCCVFNDDEFDTDMEEDEDL
jgi:hypothetical protein